MAWLDTLPDVGVTVAGVAFALVVVGFVAGVPVGMLLQLAKAVAHG
jgi:hypothetical protein